MIIKKKTTNVDYSTKVVKKLMFFFTHNILFMSFFFSFIHNMLLWILIYIILIYIDYL